MMTEFHCVPGGDSAAPGVARPVFVQHPEWSSWVRALYDDGGAKGGADTACSTSHLYVSALYWAVMTITSIGYGDIVPTRYEEYLLAIFAMLVGAITWAYVIGSACGILANLDPIRVRAEQIT